MPKLRQLESQYNERDFLAEIEGKRRYNRLSNDEFGKKIGLSGKTVCGYKKDPGKIQLETMQKMVKAIEPDIRVVLKYLGYTDKQIKNFAKETA